MIIYLRMENGCYASFLTIAFTSGKTGAREERYVIILKFQKDYFIKNPSKTGYTGSPHFWSGEGTSNHFFADVTYWRSLPKGPMK
ncbi:MAG: hypothetical protein IPI91_04415 [Flavobacteriales bacterium]|nr:hypothetical protein [Flavobacteriales bacterium]